MTIIVNIMKNNSGIYFTNRGELYHFCVIRAAHFWSNLITTNYNKISKFLY